MSRSQRHNARKAARALEDYSYAVRGEKRPPGCLVVLLLLILKFLFLAGVIAVGIKVGRAW